MIAGVIACFIAVKVVVEIGRTWVLFWNDILAAATALLSRRQGIDQQTAPERAPPPMNEPPPRADSRKSRQKRVAAARLQVIFAVLSARRRASF
ncbi:hypothetical protein CR492_02245 [Methylocella silvestris]|uniref:Uncharacterized protein n=2 Tax=Methylocella silvestris TaxID=199596 RepID=A0A2J7TM05_METSI|nr:hypothetical protein CR492_02245 [Methylocella silvestris]